MYTRFKQAPPQSFFLFGPRGIGKSTWIKQLFADQMMYFDLLKSKTLLPLIKKPDLLIQQIQGQSKKIIVIDEIQKCISLLDEVHSFMEENRDYQFILTGSSARKLKKAEANLLAGRALTEFFFPLSFYEVENKVSLSSILEYGCLPKVVSANTVGEKIRLLESYVNTYLKEEVQQEALVRNLDSFLRFLEVSANLNGQVLNLTNISREVGVGRTTVTGYYSVLIDTLIGIILPSWRPGFKVKEVDHPKFYFFDVGVVRALSDSLRDPTDSLQKGYLFETAVLHELRTAANYLNTGGEFCYWATPSGGEIDFIWKRGKKGIAFEVKASSEWKTQMGHNLKEFSSKFEKLYGVYLGDKTLQDGPIQVYPFAVFVEQLYKNKILSF